MSSTLVILNSPRDLDLVRESGVAVLARYPHALLVDATDEQRAGLERGGVEATPLPDQDVRVTGNAFDFEDAVAAERIAPVPQRADRQGYHLVRLVGPPAAAWLSWFERHAVDVHDSLEGFTLLVGAMPETVDEISAQPWVREVTPYRAAMGVAPSLRADAGRRLGAESLADPRVDTRPARKPVEVAVFPGEDLAPVVEEVETSGGAVLSAEAGVVVASVAPETIPALAALPGVRSVEPHALEVPLNDRARTVMRVPPGNEFGTTALTGKGQLVGVADSGLDTGVPATIHPDIRGRVAGLTSWPTKSGYSRFTNDPPNHDDGPADPDSGHGTHVAGSVLGDGSAAKAAGSDTVPLGIAPQATVFFQSIGQRVAWKSAEQLAREGITPFDENWPPAAASLYGLPADLAKLFGQAHAAGARVHTNSWGAPRDGAYTTTSQAVDQFVWDHPDMLILFAAGNAGADNDRSGTIDQDAISAPGTAKNCLTVGASENVRPRGSQPPPARDKMWNELRDQAGELRWPQLGPAGHVSDSADGMAAFSSRGPADDQRIKPDVVAPGTNVLSALSSVIPPTVNPLWGRLPEGHPLRPFYCWSGGTSMSTPLVAGAAAVVRQHLVDERGHQPSAALLKAFLVNGAVPMAGQFPGEIPAARNSVCGFGRVDLPRCLGSASGRPALFSDSPADAVETGEQRILRLDGVTAGEPLWVSLVWTDAPAGSGGGLVNQLYLRVIGPDGRVSLGDVSPFPDPVNNVQQVSIDNPRPGAHQVAVFGFSVITHAPGVPAGPAPRQGFAVVAANGSALTRVQ